MFTPTASRCRPGGVRWSIRCRLVRTEGSARGRRLLPAWLDADLGSRARSIRSAHGLARRGRRWAAAAYTGGPEAANAAQRGKAKLSEETARYQAWVRTMWAERDGPESSLLE